MIKSISKPKKMNIKTKTTTVLAIILLATLIFASCSSGVESDAQKVAKLQCKAQQLATKALSGDASAMEESKNLMNEAAALSKEMNEKYTTPEDKQKFAEALTKAAGNCK